MIVIKPNIVNTIKAPCREFDVNLDVTLNFYSEGNRSHDQISVPSATYANGVVTFDLLELVTEGNFYFMVLTQGNKELCKIKAFCTDQDTNADSYQISKGEFITPTQSNNDFIVL